MSVAVGDKVMLPEFGGSKIELESQVSYSSFHRLHFHHIHVRRKHKITKFLDTTYFIFSGIYALPRIRYCCKAWVTSVIDDLNYNEVPHISCGFDAKSE